MPNYTPLPSFTMLPNGDLWRGYTDASERPDNGDISDLTPDPVNLAMAKILEGARYGQPLTCVWCGQQNSDPAEMRKHVETLHVSVSRKPTDAELAQIALAQAEANKPSAE